MLSVVEVLREPGGAHDRPSKETFCPCCLLPAALASLY